MKDHLRRFDLNLLIAFRILMEERSVSKTAERLFVSQPAMSKTLQRLRIQCNDELFTRSARGLIATPKAEKLYPQVIKALTQLDQALFDLDFDPQLVDDEIRIAIMESAASFLVPKLVARFQESAPGLSLSVSSTEVDTLEQLTLGRLDFAIYPVQEFGDEFEHTPLDSFKPSIWMSRHHKLAQARQLKKKDLESYPLIMLDIPDVENRRLMDSSGFLRVTGITQRPILETSMLHMAFEVMYNSDAILIAPTHMMSSNLVRDHFIAKHVTGFKAFDKYEVSQSLIQHVRTHGSQLHAWVRQQVVDVSTQ